MVMDVDTRITDHKFVYEWRGALERLRRAKSEVSSAECAVNNAARALGRQLAPVDAKAGEAFSIWHGDELVTVSVIGSGDYMVGARKAARRV